MKKLTGILSLVTLLTGFSDPVIQASTAPTITADSPDVPPRPPVYLTGKEKVWADFPKAPPLGSPVDETDLAIILTIQAARTDGQKAEANRDKTYSINLITDVIDPAFGSKYPHTFAMLSQADQEDNFITLMLKNKNARLRPYVQHPTLVLPLFSSREFSYPSGHASGSELQARLLGQLFPARADDLLRRARQIADSRVVAGVHYASDTEAGLALGDLLFRQLESHAKFRADLANAAEKDHIALQ